MSSPDPSRLNEIVHGRTRLSILTVLANVSVMDFVSLRDQLGLSDGALSVAIKKLEDAKLVKTSKFHIDNKSRTSIQLTARGLKQLHDYLDALRAIIDAVPEVTKDHVTRSKK